MTCVRSAWLTLGGRTLLLEDESAGYFCTSLDLGSPAVRDNVSPNPDRDGAVDRTQYLGSRVVEADITALRGAGAQIDAVTSLFAPFMLPSARPVLHFVLDRPGAAERVLQLRGAQYAFKISGNEQRDIVLQWLAADPVVRDPDWNQAQSYAGTGQSGRVYNLTFSRAYPTGTQAPTTGVIQTPGDVPVRPLVRVYGPISGPKIATQVVDDTGAAITAQLGMTFVGSARVDAGHWLDIDHQKHTVRLDSDPAQSMFSSVDWSRSSWLNVPPTPGYANITLTGTGTSPITQVVAIWQDGYLS
jgi:hypothetical protein